MRNSKVSKLKREHFLKIVRGFGANRSRYSENTKFQMWRTIFRIFTILALKKLFLLVAPSGGLKHPNMQTRKVSKCDLDTFKLFTKKISLTFSVANWAKQCRHKRNDALLHEHHDFGSKISDFQQKCVRVVLCFWFHSGNSLRNSMYHAVSEVKHAQNTWFSSKIMVLLGK